jgi:hypothetical protein
MHSTPRDYSKCFRTVNVRRSDLTQHSLSYVTVWVGRVGVLLCVSVCVCVCVCVCMYVCMRECVRVSALREYLLVKRPWVCVLCTVVGPRFSTCGDG